MKNTAPDLTGNAMRKRTLEYDVGDAPMLMAALRLAACTAMMCGHHDAKRRLDVYKAMVAQHAPPEAAYFGEETWAEIVMALEGAQLFSVGVVPPPWRESRWYARSGHMVVCVGDRSWRSINSDFKHDSPLREAVLTALQELAPLDCRGFIAEQQVQA